MIGGRAFQPPRTLALMDVGNRLAEKGKDAKRAFKESLRAERERRFNDSELSETLVSLRVCCLSLQCNVDCREYAALKVVTEQDVYNRMRKEQKREAKRQKQEKQYTV
jgi:hypothetical protein